MSARAEQLHLSPWRGVFTVTGGGSSLLSELLGTAGASATVLEAGVPYAASALADLLGETPMQAVSDLTARQLAMAAWQRAKLLHDAHDSHLFGFACSASLATNREQRGDNRAHWAIQTHNATHTFSCLLDGDDRASQERILVEHIWHGLTGVLVQPPWQERQDMTHQHLELTSDWQPLFQPDAYHICTQEHDGKLLFPGAFNPLHDGHRKILSIAEQISGRAGALELCVHNADKPDLDFMTLKQRLTHLVDYPVWLTNAPTFREKAQQFPGTVFALGVDTIRRVGDIRFYQHSHALMDEAIQEMRELKVRFLVFGRSDGTRFITLDHIDLPTPLRDLCQAVPESVYRNDISSTQLRTENHR